MVCIHLSVEKFVILLVGIDKKIFSLTSLLFPYSVYHVNTLGMDRYTYVDMHNTLRIFNFSN